MRVLLVGAGASFSTKDVETGYYEAFTELGTEVELYLLDRRIAVASKWLKYQWKYLFDKDPVREPDWSMAIYRASVEALEMALRFEVDWVFVISAMYMHPDVLVMMRRAGLKVAILFTESPYEDDKQIRIASQAKICFTTERTSVGFLRQANPHTYYIQHAYSPKRHNTAPHDPEVIGHDVVFIGSGFEERVELLSSVDWTGIDLGLYGMWELLGRRHKLKRFIKGGITTNASTLDLYKASKIGLNLYRTSQQFKLGAEHILDAESVNPRAYELAASGTFCLTTPRKESLEIFGNSQPVLYNDLGGAIRYFLERPVRRMECAEEALVRVQDHTFINRARQVLAYLSNYGSAVDGAAYELVGVGHGS